MVTPLVHGQPVCNSRRHAVSPSAQSVGELAAHSLHAPPLKAPSTPHVRVVASLFQAPFTQV